MMAFDGEYEIGDDALMVMFANGDGQAASVLAARHTSRVLALAWRMLNDRSEAEDVVQDAMMRLWKIAPDWRQGEAKVSTWLYRVARNLCTDRLRRRRGTDLENVPEPRDETPAVDAQMIQSDRARALHRALIELPERQRIAVTLRHLQELSNPEIADIMETSVEAVESLLSRGKRTLSALLLGQQQELGLDR